MLLGEASMKYNKDTEKVVQGNKKSHLMLKTIELFLQINNILEN